MRLVHPKGCGFNIPQNTGSEKLLEFRRIRGLGRNRSIVRNLDDAEISVFKQSANVFHDCFMCAEIFQVQTDELGKCLIKYLSRKGAQNLLEYQQVVKLPIKFLFNQGFKSCVAWLKKFELNCPSCICGKCRN